MVFSGPIFTIITVVSTTVLVAVAMSAGFKWGMTPKHENAFTRTLKSGLLGGLIGLILFFVSWYFKKLDTNSWDTPGLIGMLPFLGMFIGELIGVNQLNKIKK